MVWFLLRVQEVAWFLLVFLYLCVFFHCNDTISMSSFCFICVFFFHCNDTSSVSSFPPWSLIKAASIGIRDPAMVNKKIKYTSNFFLASLKSVSLTDLIKNQSKASMLFRFSYPGMNNDLSVSALARLSIITRPLLITKSSAYMLLIIITLTF